MSHFFHHEDKEEGGERISMLDASCWGESLRRESIDQNREEGRRGEHDDLVHPKTRKTKGFKYREKVQPTQSIEGF
jgi:hypothetical protein